MTEKRQPIELPDVRPPVGEYFYHDGEDATTHYCYAIGNPTCFVCGKDIEFSKGLHFFGFFQCAEARRRAKGMFAYPCFEPKLHDLNGTDLIISVCKEHEQNSKILRHLTENGVITRECVLLARRAAISCNDFKKRVEDRAFAIWCAHRQDKKHANWLNALGLCIQELGHIPSFNERGVRAERLYEEGKESQAKEDWLKAEKEIGALFTIE